MASDRARPPAGADAPRSGEEERAGAAPAADADPHRVRREALARLHRFGGDRLVRDMAQIFMTDMPGRIAAARAAAAASDAARVAYAAHTMKSSSAQFGAVALARACEQAEGAARVAGQGGGAALLTLAPLVGAIEREFALFRAWLESELPLGEAPEGEGE